MKANYLIVYKTKECTGSYFTTLTVSDNATTDEWEEFSKDVKKYLVSDGAMRESDDVAIINIVKLNDVVEGE